MLGSDERAFDATDHLLIAFGSLPEVVSAALANRLGEVGPQWARGRLEAAAAAMQYVKRCQIERFPLLHLNDALADYLQFDMAYEGVERFRVLYLDSDGRLIADETVSVGSAFEAPVPLRLIVASALRLGAARLLVVHNHPGGLLTPSKSDLEVTRRLFTVADRLDMPLVDHIIVSRLGCASFKQLGLI